MSAGIQENDRHIFPRWRSFEATADLGELSLPAIELDNNTTELDLSLARGIANWEGDPSLWRGLDLLGTAIVAGKLETFSTLVAEIMRDPLAPKVARDILERTQRPERSQLLLPEYDTVPDLVAQKEIRTHRLHLASAPRDAIEWVELARSYTIAGVNGKAAKAILAALQLAPNNRFVLRSAARFLIHIGDKERAHHLLSNAPIIKQDSWIMASEIAIAASIGKTSSFWRIARAKVGMDIAPSELTELSSALGSLEAESGNHRTARRFLRQALVDANENSIAQIRWLNRSHLGEVIDVSRANPPLLHEANAWVSFYRGEFAMARDEALSWLKDQPFASAPATLSSYIFSDIFGDWASGKAITQAALRSNPDEPLLLNNLAVCLMELGELADAETALSRLRSQDRDRKMNATYKATFGMLEFRKGNAEEGRMLYLEAIEEAKNSNLKKTAARAAVHLMQEEVIAKTTFIAEATQRLKDFKDEQELSEIVWLLDRVNKRMQNR